MTVKRWLLDASALLAAVHEETGGSYVQQHIQRCCISSINWSEVLQKLGSAGIDVNPVESSLSALGLEVIDFTDKDARIAASLWVSCRRYGLSLADRACLATGMRLDTRIITADKIWSNLKINASIKLIR